MCGEFEIWDGDLEACYDAWRDLAGDAMGGFPLLRWIECDHSFRQDFARVIEQWLADFYGWPGVPEKLPEQVYSDIGELLGYSEGWYRLPPAIREAILAVYRRAGELYEDETYVDEMGDCHA